MPKIAAFLCNKWGYGALDMAGTIRAQYPPSFRTIRVPCTGRVSPDLMLRALRKGADAVAVIGWYEGECDFESGNLSAKRQVEMLQIILDAIGIEPDRVMMDNCSSAEGSKIAEIVRNYTAKIQQIGPSRLKKSVSE